MLKVTYVGRVPHGYQDSGEHVVSFFIDDNNMCVLDVVDLARYDASMCTDMIFIRFLRCEPTTEIPGWMRTTYTGIHWYYDHYFKAWMWEWERK